MYKRAALLLALLLVAACSIYVSSNDITMVPGETTTVTIEEHRYFSGTFINYGPPSIITSSNPSVAAVTRGTPVVIQALQPGEAEILTPNATYPLVKVHVLACIPIAIRPLTAPEVVTKVGTPVHLQVKTEGLLDLGTTWFEEKAGGWSMIPFSSNSKSYDFTPKASGTYRFRVSYHDRCGGADAIFTVIASTRVHAVRP